MGLNRALKLGGRRRAILGAAVVIALSCTLAACSENGQEGALQPIDYSPGELSGIDPNYDENMARCLTDAGYDVWIPPDGGVQAKVPEEQLSPLQVAGDACEAELGYANRPAPSVQELKALYRGLLALAGCLGDAGYTISNIPSEQAFIDGAVFDPYGQILIPPENAPSNEEYASLLDQCPMP